MTAGYAGRRRIPWDEVAAVRVDERRRLLLHTRLLEIETSDDLHLFSRFDLGARSTTSPPPRRAALRQFGRGRVGRLRAGLADGRRRPRGRR
ncbi:hypothetical protein BJF79_47905 [Actinomadura sp. CNU-125]|uniref:PH domain-containing protein n=1 Tax=Actinomadura sp. CNU-125 TaxID=1904961 RepID=UPI0009627B7D|nr:PH domain-containing protein [Actinomadura sp. CNU-125]OLT19342.1 hypothetical protein BJF79_47905 [Actinomadura sp. CNU-125]